MKKVNKSSGKKIQLAVNASFSTFASHFNRGVAQPGSVLAWGARGRGFKSRHPDRVKVCLSDLYLFITTKVPKKSAKIARVPGLLSFKIYSAKMDLSKTWYLDITLQDSTTGKPIRRRIKKRINEYATVSERLSFAEAYREKLTQLLLNGYRFSSQTSFDVLDEKNENGQYQVKRPVFKPFLFLFSRGEASPFAEGPPILSSFWSHSGVPVW